MGCLFSLLPGIHSLCQLYCRAERSTKKCLRLIIDWEICTRHKKLLASHFDKQCCFVRYSIALNWTRWITAQAHTVLQAFWGVFDECAQKTTSRKKVVAVLSLNNEEERKVNELLSPHIFLKIRGCVSHLCWGEGWYSLSSASLATQLHSLHNSMFALTLWHTLKHTFAGRLAETGVWELLLFTV